MIKRTFFILLMVNILMLCGTVEEVVADDKKAKAGIIDLESITITASRMKGAAHESSYNITIINEADIEQAHAKSTPDLLKDLEGAYVYDSSGVGTTGRVNMRGFWGGMSTNQLVLIDGVPQNKASDKLVNWDLIPVDNIKSIEIVRGPVSALYGDNAMSGVINIITKAPTAQPKLKVSGSYLRYNTQNYNAYVSGMIKKFGYYFAVSSKSTDGFRRHSDYANINVLGKIDLKVNETETLKFSSAYHEKKEGAFPWALTEAQMDEDRRRARPGTQSDKSKVRKSDSSLTYLNEVNADLNMEGTLYYRYEDVDSYYTPTARFTSTVEQIDYENVYGLLLSCSTTPKIFNMEYLLAAGVDLELDDFDYKEYAAPFQARSVRIGDYTVNRKKAGPYIHGEVKVSELLKLSTAIRYDFVAFDFTDQLDAPKSRIRNMSNINLNCGIVSNYRKKSKFYVNYG
ncbi:MAG: TonB-dependent receptor plug domain-containing protein [Candidatus Omnitrophica bacterium]|nr:TonB-dependent receptor plug domain-containing protein [Candidatus Omnitrophota bacterium]